MSLKLFRSVIFRISTEYEDLQRKSLYSVRMSQNMDQKKSKYGHFSQSENGVKINR